jgi:hypothetical protein
MTVGTKVRRAACAGVVVAVAATGVAWAASSTTVKPAGDYVKSALHSGASVSLKLGSVAVTCNQSATVPTLPLGANQNNRVKLAPGNHNAAGPVSIVVNPPTFKNNGGACPSNLFGATVTLSTNHTNGNWTLALQNGAPVKGSLTIPKAGAVGTTSIAGCSITVAPLAPATVSGTWTNGSAGSPSRLTIANASVPVKIAGGSLCPKGTVGTISASYDVADASHTTSSVVVTP